MYYWLQEADDVYVICDQVDDVYKIDEKKAYLQKMNKHQILKFKPYVKEIKVTEDFDLEVIK